MEVCAVFAQRPALQGQLILIPGHLAQEDVKQLQWLVLYRPQKEEYLTKHPGDPQQVCS